MEPFHEWGLTLLQHSSGPNAAIGVAENFGEDKYDDKLLNHALATNKRAEKMPRPKLTPPILWDEPMYGVVLSVFRVWCIENQAVHRSDTGATSE